MKFNKIKKEKIFQSSPLKNKSLDSDLKSEIIIKNKYKNKMIISYNVKGEC